MSFSLNILMAQFLQVISKIKVFQLETFGKKHQQQISQKQY